MTTMLPERPLVEKPTEVEILERAAELLEEFGWCQCSLAKWADGSTPAEVPDIRDPQIESFCVMGAIWRAGADLGYISPRWNDLMEAGEGIGDGVFSFLARKAGVDNWAPLVAKNDIDSTEAQEMTAHLRSLAKERMPA